MEKMIPIEQSLSFTSSAIELEHLGDRGVPTRIPRRYLFGTQQLDHYSDRRRRNVDRLLREQGVRFLEDKPIIPCVLNNSSDYTVIAILQGHHRTRMAGKHRINRMPSRLLVVEEVAEVLNNRFEADGRNIHVTPDNLTLQLMHDIAVTVDSFNVFGKDIASPSPIPGRWSRDQLVEMFAETHSQAA